VDGEKEKAKMLSLCDCVGHLLGWCSVMK